MIRVRNLENSIPFYGDFRGLDEVRQKDIGNNATLVFLADENQHPYLKKFGVWGVRKL